MRHLPRRCHRVAPPCGARARGGDVHDSRSRQPQRDLREPPPHRNGRPLRRRRGADRQVPADVPPAISTVTTPLRAEAEPRLRTIGAVCEELRNAFPDISVSKIRYLEDQGLITPRRTRGGYRLFSAEDVERLATILRLQRDEFLPLRVIRQELDGPGAADRSRRRPAGLTGYESEITGAELCERAGVSPDFLHDLEEFGVVL